MGARWRTLRHLQLLAVGDHIDDQKSVRAIGEVAHNVARSVDAPRGDSTTVVLADRDDPDNLLLLCPNDHTAADKRIKDPVYTEEYLREVKHRHEAFVKQATSMRDQHRTVVLRMRGDVRGTPGTITPSQAAEATMNNAGRVPWYLADPNGQGTEIDLTQLPPPESPRLSRELLKLMGGGPSLGGADRASFRELPTTPKREGPPDEQRRRNEGAAR